MTLGRRICDALKDVRKRIADANGIHYVPTECTHKGECAGTCPRCDQELSDLTKEIRRRHRLGMATSVAGIAVGIGSLASCHVQRPNITAGVVIYASDSTEQAEMTPDTPVLNPEKTDIKP